MANEYSESGVARRLLRQLREALRKAAAGLVLAVVAGIIVTAVTALLCSGPVATRDCDGPRVNFPTEGLGVQEVVDVAGSIDCLEKSVWITVTPPLGRPHGIHPTNVDLQRKSFSGIAVLSSGPGAYRICAAVADADARQTFEGALQQDPPVGLPSLPPGALLESCVRVVMG